MDGGGRLARPVTRAPRRVRPPAPKTRNGIFSFFSRATDSSRAGPTRASITKRGPDTMDGRVKAWRGRDPGPGNDGRGGARPGRKYSRFARLRRLIRALLYPLAILPRGVGSTLTFLFVIGAAVYGTLYGEHLPLVADQVRDTRDGVANAMGFTSSRPRSPAAASSPRRTFWRWPAPPK